jgi:hypothetical protein
MIQFKGEICGLEAALRRVRLETNGLGALASSTIIGLNARRYHGLLVGGGDWFASGLIYGFLSGRGPQWAVDVAVLRGHRP